MAGPRMQSQLERTLLIIELLAPLRHGATVDEIVEDVGGILGVKYVERTIRRDLSTLKRLGIVEHGSRGPQGQRGPVPTKWRLNGSSMKAAILRQVAEHRSEMMDSA